MMDSLWALGEMGKEEPKSASGQRCPLSESVALDAPAQTDCAQPRSGADDAPTVCLSATMRNCRGEHRSGRYEEVEGGTVVAEEDRNIPRPSARGDKQLPAAHHNFLVGRETRGSRQKPPASS